MKLKTTFLVSCFIPLLAMSQVTFQKTYGGNGNDEGYSVKQSSDGGYVIAGYTESFGAGNQDAYLMKTDSAGNVLWSKSYGATSYDIANSVQQTSDGGYIMAGIRTSPHYLYLIKTDNNGDTLWTKSIDAWNASAVRQTTDGGYIIAGYYSFGFSTYYLTLTKTDSIGTLLWSERITTAPFQSFTGWDVQQATDGGYVAIGTINAGGSRVCLVKTDTVGNVVWLKIYGTVFGEGWSVGLTNDNGYIITGSTGSGAGVWDVCLLKTDSSGNVIWSKTFGGADEDLGASVQQTSDGGYIVAGYTKSFGAGNEDIYLVKTDGNGNLLWSKTYGGTESESYYFNYYSVQQTMDDGYIITSSTTSFGPGDRDVYLIKTDSLGNSGCNESNPATITNLHVTPVATQTSAVSMNTGTSTLITSVGGGCLETTLCIITGAIETGNKTFSLSLFPNPATSQLRIYSSEFRVEGIEMYNALGEKVIEEQLKTSNFQPQTNSLDVSSLALGMYFMKVKTAKGEAVAKFVKQ